MKLPQVKERTILTFKLCGYTLHFRKGTVKDTDLLIEEISKGHTITQIGRRMLAELMYGYDETVEQRMEFIENLEISGAADFSKISDILEKLNMKMDVQFVQKKTISPELAKKEAEAQKKKDRKA